MVMDPNGPLIGYAWFEQLEAENARLKAEVESVRQVAQDNKTETEATRIENARLKAEVERLTQNTDKLCKHGDLEIDRLKVEVERLRKAGDAMCKFFDDHGFYGFGFQEAWNAAKEGKQP